MIAFAIGALIGFLFGVKFAPHIYLIHAEWVGRNSGEDGTP